MTASQELSSQDPQMQDLESQESTQEDPTAQDPEAQDPTAQDPSIYDKTRAAGIIIRIITETKTLAILAVLCMLGACTEFFAGEPGRIEISIHAPRGLNTATPTTYGGIGPASSDIGPSSSITSSSTATLPVPDDFIIMIRDAEGETVYEGRLGDSPESITVPRGSYEICALSEYFTEPEFSSPQYGDTQVISVGSGETVSAELFCKQINSGLRLSVNDSFRNCFPAGALLLRSDSGELAWDYEETRIAYFSPGQVIVSLTESGYSQKLFSRELEAQEILQISLSASVDGSSGGISLQLDSSRTWLSDSFIHGEDNSSEIWGAYDVSQARQNAGKEGVWVRGYIVGVATGTGKIDFEPPFDKNTNIILGLRSASSDKSYCLSVELKSGAIRDELNLVDHPELLGRHIYMKGDLVSAYYGIPGLKNLEEYQLSD